MLSSAVTRRAPKRCAVLHLRDILNIETVDARKRSRGSQRNRARFAGFGAPLNLTHEKLRQIRHNCGYEVGLWRR